MEESCPLQYIADMYRYYLDALPFVTATVALDLIYFLENRNYY